MRILIIDGKGGGLGSSLIERIKKEKLNAKITAVGTNAIATGAMNKSGADECATGENAVIYNAGKADIILGPIGIIVANSMVGEVSPAMSAAVCEAEAKKVLIPVNKCSVYIAGSQEMVMKDYLDEVIKEVTNILKTSRG